MHAFAKGPKFRVPLPINRKFNFKILLDVVEDYPRQWAKRKGEEQNTLFEWVKDSRKSNMNSQVKRPVNTFAIGSERKPKGHTK